MVWVAYEVDIRILTMTKVEKAKDTEGGFLKTLVVSQTYDIIRSVPPFVLLISIDKERGTCLSSKSLRGESCRVASIGLLALYRNYGKENALHAIVVD